MVGNQLPVAAPGVVEIQEHLRQRADRFMRFDHSRMALIAKAKYRCIAPAVSLLVIGLGAVAVALVLSVVA